MSTEAPELEVVNVHPTRKVDLTRIEALARYVLKAEGVVWKSVGVILSDSQSVHELNRDFLDHDYPTDVLSFLLEESPIEGEVYVDLDTADENARRFGTRFNAEVARYVAHGLLHLAGHDDATALLRAGMAKREDHCLIAMGYDMAIGDSPAADRDPEDG